MTFKIILIFFYKIYDGHLYIYFFTNYKIKDHPFQLLSISIENKKKIQIININI